MANLDAKKEVRFYPASQLKVEKRYNGKSKISGYSAVFDRLSEDLGGFREKIKPGAFTNALAVSDVRALFNHDANFILGRESAGTLKLQEDGKGLHMDLEPPDTQFWKDLSVSIERGDIKDQSFGFIVGRDSWENIDDENKMTIRTIEKIDQLFDVSIVTFPAYPDTSVALRSRTAARNLFSIDYDYPGHFDHTPINNRKRLTNTKAVLDRVDRTLSWANWYTDPVLFRVTKILNQYGRYNDSYRRRKYNSPLLDKANRILKKTNKYKYNVPAMTPKFSRSTQILFERMDIIRRRLEESGNLH